VQWSFSESSEDLVRAISIAIMKHGRPCRFLSDNGAAMRAKEYIQGLERLGVFVNKIRKKKPNQNGKTEVHWASMESKLLAMLIGQEDLNLGQLNEMTIAWAELGYNRNIHREIKMTPLDRYLSSKNVGSSSCDEDTLKRAFRIDEFRCPRQSDHTITIDDILFRLPQQFWPLDRILVRYARWDLSFVHVVDFVTSKEIMRIFPVDKEANADGKRRSISTPIEVSTERKRTTLPPYMQDLVRQYRELTHRCPWVNSDHNLSQNKEP
jgi:hypothetical protein